MAKKKRTNDYFGIDSRVLNLILVIIPITSMVCGVVTRIMEGKIVAGLLRIILGWNIIWILDIVFMILNKKIFRLLNV